MRISNLIMLCILLCNLASAQISCGQSKLISANLEYFDNLETSNDDAIDFSQKSSTNYYKKSSFENVVLTVPVVFHVLYNSINENIEDSIIVNQLEYLNEVFSGCSNTVRDEFKDVNGCPKILFELAKINPQGEASNGITRTYTSVTNFEKDQLFEKDFPKFDKYGGINAWNNQEYLNIWVCNLYDISSSTPIYGYAFPPNYSPNWPNFYITEQRQGIVIDFRVVGSNNGGNNGIHPSQGVLVHELGHYFGLKHIWGDSVGSCLSDDNIWDTPNCRTPSLYCNFDLNSCIESQLMSHIDKPDMVENHMNYSIYDNCTKMFTIQQCQLMRFNLIFNRSKLPFYDPIIITPSSSYLRVFPNPFENKIAVNFEYWSINSATESTFKCEIQSMTGEVVFMEQVKPLALNILNLSDLPLGVYVIRIYSEISNSKSLRIIKQ